jgi:hypothetical protein
MRLASLSVPTYPAIASHFRFFGSVVGVAMLASAITALQLVGLGDCVGAGKRTNLEVTIPTVRGLEFAQAEKTVGVKAAIGGCCFLCLCEVVVFHYLIPFVSLLLLCA